MYAAGRRTSHVTFGEDAEPARSEAFIPLNIQESTSAEPLITYRPRVREIRQFREP